MFKHCVTGSVYDSRIFLKSGVNKILRKEIITRCKKVIVDGGDAAYPLLPFLIKVYPKGLKNVAGKYFGYKLSSGRISIEYAFVRIKGRFAYLRKVVDVNIRNDYVGFHFAYFSWN